MLTARWIPYRLDTVYTVVIACVDNSLVDPKLFILVPGPDLDLTLEKFQIRILDCAS
jgi:hypothetical protein